MFQWAEQHKVSHYTFWIQPMTDEMIEKHEAFMELEYLFDKVKFFKKVEKFNGRILQKGEGDGSSFPNGGLRGTEKARAYIAWDSQSDIFIREGLNKTLYIPAMLVTHHGEALDEKSYLRRAESKLKESTIKLLAQLGEKNVNCVSYSLGIEQEFFVIKKEEYEARVDLCQTGRTLYGLLPPRNQQFADHYYSKIGNELLDILSECENSLIKLGVPVKTKHKEVALNQFEMSCFYEDAVNQVDHNMLMMDVLKTGFDKHGYKVLFHEKPWKGANGSGKHCNWSLMYSKGGKFENLFEPGEKPSHNVKFLMFLLITLKAVQKNAGLLKASVTSPTNEIRMGGHEAPPCIISVFLGSYIDRLLNSIENSTEFNENPLNLAQLIPGIEQFMQDNTDRNRTSPFAFTGNKFEFRAVGSRQNASFPMTVIAAILTEQMDDVAAQLAKGKDPWEIIRQLIKDTKRIRFEGDGYSKEWEEEAEKRGVPHLRTAKSSFECIKNAEVLKNLGIFSANELKARYSIASKLYENTKVAEAKTYLILIHQQFLPRAARYLAELAPLAEKVSAINAQVGAISKLYDRLYEQAHTLEEMVEAVNNALSFEDKLDRATELRYKMEEVFKALSELEALLPREKINDPPQLYDMLKQ